MPLLAQLEHKKNLKIYQPDRCSAYSLQSNYSFDREVDDYYIDRHNRVYTIFNRTIYALRNRYIMIAEKIYTYEIVDTELGVLFYYIIKPIDVKDAKNPYRLSCREVKDEIELETELLSLEHSKYRIIVVDVRSYILYDRNTLLIKFKEKFNRISLTFDIKQACYLEHRVVMLDTESNIQIYDLREMRLGSGFKAIALAHKMISQKELNLICLDSDDGFFIIDVKNRNILKKKTKDEIAFSYSNMKFANKRSLLFFGEGVWELCLTDDSFYTAIQPRPNCEYKYFDVNQGYILDLDPITYSTNECFCYQNLLSMKLEMRRELFELGRELEELKEEVKRLKDK